MQKQKGFTLIELVVVIVILGVLAAVALPRFMNATEDAHTAAVKGTGGALAAGVALVRSQWELNRVKGVANPYNNVTSFGEGLMDVNATGWPVGETAAVSTPPQAAPSSANQCIEIWKGVLQGSAPSIASSAAGAATQRDYDAATSAEGCTFTYRQDGRTTGQRTIAYNAATGAVTTSAN